ncbi:hypothetical protein V1512DRAFT_267826 [Lipomyces arxii]|uniref:uncharacterized protein n=1 Tax=Lipomyces arxii TaxID=56418 RepID=UPI0034CEF96A
MKHPAQKLVYNSKYNALFLAVEDRIQKFDVGSQELLLEWLPSTSVQTQNDFNNEPSKKKIKADQKLSDNIRTLTCTADGEYAVASTDESKSLLVFSSKTLQLLSTRPFPKRPSAIAVTRDSSTILLGDKFGDVYSVPVLADTNATSTSAISKLSESETESGGDIEPILGHVSMLVDLTVVEDKDGDTHIITSDRDEHIRVSKFPQAFIIERFCFGHEQYVSQLLVPLWQPNILISGGGDDFLACWDWSTGELLDKFDIKSRSFPSADEPSTQNVAVSGMWQVPELQMILVYNETAEKLFILKLSGESKANLLYINACEESLADIAATGTGGLIWISKASDVGDADVVRLYRLLEDGTMTPDVEISNCLSRNSSFTICSQETVTAIRPVGLVRKHAEH